jgi:hypothetical protein
MEDTSGEWIIMRRRDQTTMVLRTITGRTPCAECGYAEDEHSTLSLLCPGGDHGQHFR